MQARHEWSTAANHCAPPPPRRGGGMELATAPRVVACSFRRASMRAAHCAFLFGLRSAFVVVPVRRRSCAARAPLQCCSCAVDDPLVRGSCAARVPLVCCSCAARAPPMSSPAMSRALARSDLVGNAAPLCGRRPLLHGPLRAASGQLGSALSQPAAGGPAPGISRGRSGGFGGKLAQHAPPCSMKPMFSLHAQR